MNPLPLAALGISVLGALAAFALGLGRGLTLLATVAIVVVGLALVTGGQTAVAAAMIVAYMSPVLLASVLLGAVAGNLLRAKRLLAGTLAMLPIPFLVAFAKFDAVRDDEERRLAVEFVQQEPRILKLASGPISVRPAPPTTFSDRSRARYEFDFPGKSSHYIVVDVSRSGGRSHFRLSCVTTLPMGRRQGSAEPCDEGAIELPAP